MKMGRENSLEKDVYSLYECISILVIIHFDKRLY